MGLDSYWSKTPDPNSDDVEAARSIAFVPPLNLCGGILSGNGRGSFRGKVYAELIEEITGVSIYQEWIDNETVKRMADRLSAKDPDLGGFPDFDDLARMFRTYADAGYGLIGWW